MFTQEDIHNAIVECASPEQKAYIAKTHGGDITKIKETEKFIADTLNLVFDVFSDSFNYLNEKIGGNE